MGERFTAAPGVYTFFKRRKLAYVGETANLRERMRDFLDRRHHTLRRHLGTRSFFKVRGYRPASSKAKFPPVVETALSAYITSHLMAKAVPIQFGRKEIDERISKLKAPP